MLGCVWVFVAWVLTWFANSQTGSSSSSSSSVNSPRACENWGRHQSRQETPISNFLTSRQPGCWIQGQLQPHKMCWGLVSKPTEILHSSKPQPRHFQMTSLQTARTASSFYFKELSSDWKVFHVAPSKHIMCLPTLIDTCLYILGWMMYFYHFIFLCFENNILFSV